MAKWDKDYVLAEIAREQIKDYLVGKDIVSVLPQPVVKGPTIPTEAELYAMSLQSKEAIKQMKSWGIPQGDSAGLDKRPEHSPNGLRYQAKKWRTGYEFPSGKRLNPPRQKHCKRMAVKPMLKRQAQFLLQGGQQNEN